MRRNDRFPLSLKKEADRSLLLHRIFVEGGGTSSQQVEVMTDQAGPQTPHSVPLWEHENIAKAQAAGKIIETPSNSSGWKRRLDNALPPYKTYLGLRRKWFVMVCAAVVAALGNEQVIPAKSSQKEHQSKMKARTSHPFCRCAVPPGSARPFHSKAASLDQ